MTLLIHTFISILYFSSENFKCKDGRTDDTLNLKNKTYTQLTVLELSRQEKLAMIFLISFGSHVSGFKYKELVGTLIN